MARTALTPIEAPAAYAKTPVEITWTAGDVVNGNEFTATGRELVLARNVDGAAAHVCTVQSVALNNRTGEATESIPLGAYRTFQVFPTAGWQQSDGKIYIDVDDAQIELAIIRLP